MIGLMADGRKLVTLRDAAANLIAQLVPNTDYENDRFIYVCAFCHRWGLSPLRVDFPPTDEITSKFRESVPVCRSKRR
jgi:hypothetical protein